MLNAVCWIFLFFSAHSRLDLFFLSYSRECAGCRSKQLCCTAKRFFSISGSWREKSFFLVFVFLVPQLSFKRQQTSAARDSTDNWRRLINGEAVHLPTFHSSRFKTLSKLFSISFKLFSFLICLLLWILITSNFHFFSTRYPPPTLSNFSHATF